MRCTKLASVLVATFFALFAMLGHVLVAFGQSPPPAPPFVVVVHPSNPNHTLSRKFLGDAFLKKTTRWPNGDVIRPVDLPVDSGVRERFSQDVIRRSAAEVRSYWQQVIFSGRDVPPPEVPDDEAVLKYVAQHASAVGYVSGTARLGDVKPVGLE